MPTPKQLPSGKWRVQASAMVNGISTRKSFTAATPAKVLTLAEEWQRKASIIADDSSALTIYEALEEYISMKSNLLSPTTISGYKKIMRNYINEIEKLRINQLTCPILQKWINNLSGKYSPKTVTDAYCLLKAVIRVFAPEFSNIRVTLPQKRKPKSNALSKSEISALLKGIQGHPLEIPILLALWLGMRRSEIMALEWSDVDFEKMTIDINKAYVYTENGYITKSPKTIESNRILKMPLYISEKLKVSENRGKRIFANIDPNRCTKDFPAICEELGIKKYRFHDLRHSMATVGVTLNIADKLVMARGGWNDISTVKNIYQTVLSEDLDMADTLYDNYFTHLLEA